MDGRMPYEPWIPPVGQRVRVRATPECPANHAHADGHTGVVTETSRTDDPAEVEAYAREFTDDPEGLAYAGHWYWVEFDSPSIDPVEQRPIVADLFAAVELEPEGVQ